MTLKIRNTKILYVRTDGSSNVKNGAPDWSRTSDPFLRREVLYPTELRVRASFLPESRGFV